MNSVVECIYHHHLRAPEKCAVITEKDRVSYAELWRMIRFCALRLKDKGVSAGDRVMIEAPSTAEYQNVSEKV